MSVVHRNVDFATRIIEGTTEVKTKYKLFNVLNTFNKGHFDGFGSVLSSHG